MWSNPNPNPNPNPNSDVKHIWIELNWTEWKIHFKLGEALWHMTHTRCNFKIKILKSKGYCQLAKMYDLQTWRKYIGHATTALYKQMTRRDAHRHWRAWFSDAELLRTHPTWFDRLKKTMKTWDGQQAELYLCVHSLHTCARINEALYSNVMIGRLTVDQDLAVRSYVWHRPTAEGPERVDTLPSYFVFTKRIHLLIKGQCTNVISFIWKILRSFLMGKL